MNIVKRAVSVLPILILSLIVAGCRRSAQYYLNIGNRYYDQGKFDDASINYRKSLQSEPSLAESHYRLGLAELKQGNLNDAYTELRQASQLAPRRDDIRVDLADVALNGYQASKSKPKILYDQVVTTASDLLAKDPKSFDGLRLRANVLTVDGRLDEALEVYKKANAIRPMDPTVIYPMVQVQFRLNHGPEGEELAKHLLQVHQNVGTVYDLLVARYIAENRKGDAEQLLKSKVTNFPKDERPLLQLAELYRQQQRLPEMSQTLDRILNNPKDFPRGREMVGDFYAGIGKFDDAIRQYNAGLTSSPKDKVLYQKKIVKTLAGQGKRDAAIEILNDVLTVNPDDFDARTARAILLRESNDANKLSLAMSDLNLLVAKNPNDEIVRYNLGLVYLAKGDPKNARMELAESAKRNSNYTPPRLALAGMAQRARNYSETIEYANQILAVDPANSDARLWHAAGLIGNKIYGQARIELDALLREHSDSLIINLTMAALDTAEKKYAPAETRCLRFYKAGQRDLRPLEALVQLYTAQRQSDKALKLLENEVKQAPDSFFVHLLLASTAGTAGKLDLAEQQYQWLRAKDPKSAVVSSSLGEVYQLKGDIASALSNYENARELSPNDPSVIAMIAFLQNASGKEPDAITNLQKQLAMDPQNVVAMNNLAFILADTSTDLDRALALAQTAQRKAPNNAGVADTVGWVYVKKGLNDSAIQIFNGLVKKYPDDASFRYHLGIALLQKGQTALAKDQFTISLSKKPPKEIADKIMQIISKIG